MLLLINPASIPLNFDGNLWPTNIVCDPIEIIPGEQLHHILQWLNECVYSNDLINPE